MSMLLTFYIDVHNAENFAGWDAFCCEGPDAFQCSSTFISDLLRSHNDEGHLLHEHWNPFEQNMHAVRFGRRPSIPLMQLR